MTAIRDLSLGEKKPRRLLGVVGVLVLATLAAICPFLSAAVIHFSDVEMPQRQWMNAGGLTALLVSPLVALRTGRLRDFLVGPTVGLLAGFLDLKAMLWLYTTSTADWSIAAATNAPVWGGICGLWVASGRRHWLGWGATCLAIMSADLAMRLAWSVCGPILYDKTFDVDTIELWQWWWLIEAVVYSPAAVLMVLLAGASRRNPGQSPP
ncbi:MAG TPA: hypothetical protein VHC22_33440 [Pirellulales bacterium]|nr:hypothetical protein [Pirellulales bacterium]